MADLFDRIFGDIPGGETIAVHTWEAAIVDYMAGQTTRAQIIAGFNLDAEATADLDFVLSEVDSLGTVLDKIRFIMEMDAVNILAETELKYNTKSAYRARLFP